MASEPFFSLDGPLDVSPASGQVRAANFAGFAQLARTMGRDARGIVERHGMEARVLSDPESHIAAQQLADVFEYCSAAFDDSLFGLHFAQNQDPDVFGCITALARAAPDVRTALGAFVEYMPVVHSPDSEVLLIEGAETAEFCWQVNTDLGVNDQAHYQAAMLNVKLLQMLGGPQFRPTWISLSAEPRAADIPEMERLLGCRVHPRSRRNSVAFPIHTLDQPVPTANRLLYRLLGGYLERVRDTQKVGLAEKAASYIRGALPMGNCSIERCAAKLGLSVRTLQGRLAEQGLRFSEMVEHQREAMARDLLKASNLSLDEIAERLGYGEQTSFGRAFKRWTGMTPQAFRQAA
ncbi:AraC family transcriptional regulator [Novosphingobium sp. TH158]|uniref:AraC family transcriptional regulator n=1 Tax=Novosphingobium sp. TH158 TaxID=2067455 RepID=UPI000C79C097|nr:AraC family transcriptional regulator [Novosphingobium sp. TH158]PLK27806.1 AraC family transcriptional regulator [Novosphingobium sp. TH158]